MTAKMKTKRQLEDDTQKFMPNQKVVTKQLSKIKEETGETIFSTYSMLYAEKEREQKICEEHRDARLMHPDNLPTVRLEVRPVTAPGKVTGTNQSRHNLPPRSKTVLEETPPSDNENVTKGKPKHKWESAFQKVKLVQSISGAIQIEGRSSRLRRRLPGYESPEYAFIKPLKMDVKQKKFPEMQAKYWAEKFQELLKLWEIDRHRRPRFRDILPEPPAYKSNQSTAAERVNQFVKKYGQKYSWAFVGSLTENDHHQKIYVPIRRSEMAAVEDELNKRKKETELLKQRSLTIVKEVDNLTRLKRRAYDPDTY